MTQSLELIAEQNGVALDDPLKSAFAPLFDKATEWKLRIDGLNVTDVSQVREMKLARESRLALKEIRCDAERKRKTLKEDVLRRGKAIDGLYNVIAFLVEPLEKQLLDMEQFAERKEAARLDEQLVERKKALAHYNHSSLDDATVRGLSDDSFNEVLEAAKALHEARQREAERIEKERLARERAEAEERERIRVENERLKVEAAAREKQMREEQAKRDEAARVEAEKAKAERDKLEAKAKAERLARQKVERELAEQKHREEVARVEAAVKAKAEKDAAEKARKKAEAAPDKAKLEKMLADMMAVEVPTMATAAGAAVLAGILADLSRFEFQTTQNILKL